MARAFSQAERELIDQKLREAAKDCLRKYGVRKTTVDELVQMAGISKGSFYNFYSGKEILFFKVLEEYQASLFRGFLANLAKPIGVQGFTKLIYGLYQEVRDSFLLTIIQNEELDYLIRKIPKEIIANHHSFDELLAEELFSLMQLKPQVCKGEVVTALRTLFISLIHVDAVGEKHYDGALRLLIEGLALQIIGGD